MVTNQEMTSALWHPPIFRRPPTGYRHTDIGNENEKKLKPNPRVTAYRLIAIALDDDDSAKSAHLRLILNQIDGSKRDVLSVLIELADMAAAMQKSRYGIYAHVKTLQEIETLVVDNNDSLKESQNLVVERKPPRPYKDTRRNN